MSPYYPATVSTTMAIEAAEARCNLHAFAAVVTLLEGGHVTGHRAGEAAAKIIKLAKAEQQRQLAEYDKALGRKDPA